MARSKQSIEEQKKTEPVLGNAVAIRYVSAILIIMDTILLLVAVLVLTDVYDGIGHRMILWCLAIATGVTAAILCIRMNRRFIENRWSGYIVILSFILLILVLSSMLNSYVTLALVLPMVVAQLYYDDRISWHAYIGSLLTAISGPITGYLLGTWSSVYLAGFLRVVCRVEVSLSARESVNVAKDIGEILLYYVLPQLAILTIIQAGIRVSIREGVRAKQLQAEMVKANNTDLLTKLYTRACFFQMGDEILQTEPGRSYAVVVTDIERFRLYNDFYGHAEGDELLRYIADMLQEYVGKQGIVGRMDGDHMGILIPEDRFDALDFENEFLKKIHESHKGKAGVRVRAGVYYAKDRKISISGMTDRALLASHSIRDQQEQYLARFEESMLQDEREEEQLIERITRGLENDEFCVYLQPQADLEGRIQSAEVLARWKTPDGIVHAPGEFIETCERNGLISDLDRVIWKQACLLIQKWKKENRRGIALSINISPMDFYKMDVYQTLTDLVAALDVDPSQLHLEITETAAMTDLEGKLQLFRKLKSAGFEMEMDDFGSGYSSLGMLKTIPMDTLKLDMTFLSSGKGSDSNDEKNKGEKIIASVIHLGKELGMKVLVEGVETEDQVQKLRQMGCQYYQGSYYSAPMPVEEFEDRYLK